MSTIFALSTVYGRSGVAIFRISGANAMEVKKIFHISKLLTPRYAVFTPIYTYKTKEIIDEVIILRFCAPRTPTGEEVIEIHCHGSTAIIKIITEELSVFFKLAEPGEFTKRAFLNGKLDLTRAEGLIDLINAQTRQQAKQAIQQLQGHLEKVYNDWREKIITILASLEGYIDFPDEGLPLTLIEGVRKQITNLHSEINNALNDNRIGEIIRNGFNIVIVGPPNSGKSTLINYLAKKEIAIVSAYPGTTRDVIEVNLDLDGYPVTISDTAGLRESLDIIEKEGIMRAYNKAQKADLCLVVISSDLLAETHNHVQQVECEHMIYVASKADYFTEEGIEIKVGNKKFLPISVHNKLGLSNLIKHIKTIIQEKIINKPCPIITRERHRKALIMVNNFLQNSQTLLINEVMIELLTEELRLASRALGDITGIIRNEEVLDELFSTLCIGK